MKLTFTDQCSSTMTTGGSNLYSKLCGVDAYHVWASNLTVDDEIKALYEKCITFIGGFVDYAYFKKMEIESLNQDDLELFMFSIVESAIAHKMSYMYDSRS